MPELHLKHPVFTYRACGPFTKHRERIKKVRETGNFKHLYRNKLVNTCFAHDAANCDSKNLASKTFSDKSLKGRAYEIARHCKYDGNQKVLVSMIYKLFIRKQYRE